MGATTSYGTWVNHGYGEIDLKTNVAVSLGDFVQDFDVDGLVQAYRDAINSELDAAGDGVRLAGDEFFGPHPRSADAHEVIAQALEAVDFWALARKFDRS